MKNKYKLMMVLIIIIVGALLTDWKDFKAGLLGQPPFKEVENTK